MADTYEGIHRGDGVLGGPRPDAADATTALAPAMPEHRHGRAARVLAARGAIDALPGPQRAVILMAVEQGLTVTAIARATATPRQAVIGLLATAMRDLERCLRDPDHQREAQAPTRSPRADDANGAANPSGRG